MVMVWCELLSWHQAGETEENYEKHQIWNQDLNTKKVSWCFVLFAVFPYLSDKS
jgi:hypothetical protein